VAAVAVLARLAAVRLVIREQVQVHNFWRNRTFPCGPDLRWEIATVHADGQPGDVALGIGTGSSDAPMPVLATVRLSRRRLRDLQERLIAFTARDAAG
jgi:hypothetical protein